MSTPPLPYQEACQECARLRAAERAARLDRNPSKEVDYRVMARRHLRVIHRVVSVVRA
ncbi:hypothetical protein [Streptantibioticus ferralitis]|uniref:Uncharacterized protein n=1 Tax=Streptantibioticus ferralitis TaxID=236510 RepID=A0ABT5ZB57_9ACTN|nr:hypothetical protein [Streptantibioticus ferralitis]MDF2260953.1 hypothetical protein [Streptantibioticus ferralitis]